VLQVRLGPAEVRFTGRADGDMGHGGEYVTRVTPEVEAKRRAVVDMPWTWLRQVHAARVVHVRGPGDQSGVPADAAVTLVSGAALAVLTADCAAIALASREGVIGAVHAGWRGLVADVVPRAVDVMRELGATDVDAVMGPCIHAECYEFGEDGLDRVAAHLGAGVRGITSTGRPALDLPAAVRAALRGAGVRQLDDMNVCTACSPDYFSHRARGEVERQAMVVWR